MKKSLSSNDLLLLLGILVAVIIVFTTLVYKDGTPGAAGASNGIAPPKKTSIISAPAVLFKKILGQAASSAHPASSSR